MTDKERKDFAQEFSSYQFRAVGIPFVKLIEVLGLPQRVLLYASEIDGKILRKLEFMNYFAGFRVVEMGK